MTKRKFYKTKFVIVVLSEEPLPDGMAVGEVAYSITDGDCSGSVDQEVSEELDGQKAADELVNQGSDPSFFGLTPTGDDNDGNRIAI